MKKFLTSIAALVSVGLVAAANAADLPVKAPPPVLPALYNWSGVYIGVEGGAVMGQNTDWNFLNARVPTENAGLQPLCTSPLFFEGFPGINEDIHSGPGTCSDVGHPLHGGFVGGEIGFNWQAPGSRWVFGIEGDGNWAELEEALTCAPPFTGYTCGSKIRDFETVRVRIGYAFGPTGDFLAYLTGGWATASVKAFEGQLVQPFFTVTDQKRHNGFVVGGGAEYGITPWLSLKGEVLYVWLEGKDHCFGNCAEVTLLAGGEFIAVPAHVKEDFVLARMGLNWRFGWVGKGKAPLAVMAKY
jgi:outer membrane immunogenic protein